MVDKDTASAIFQAPIPFNDVGKEEKACKNIIASLSESQLEKAARTSYAYYAAVTNPEIPTPSQEVKEKMAMRMARRHLVAEKGDQEKALSRMKKTLEFRDEYNIDELRETYDETKNYELDHPFTHPGVDHVCVNGYDVYGHAVCIRFPRAKYVSYSDESFFRLNIYSLERALACTERRSLGRQEKIIIALDYNRYKSGSTPPFTTMRGFLSIFSSYYPETLYKFIGVEPPYAIELVRTLLWPFIDAGTKEKVMFIRGEEKREKELEKLFDLEETMPFFRKEGQLKEWNIKDYFLKIPFDGAAFEK